ncbi:MAG: hypothetical protein JWM92_509 [Candidatus Nomurabacteria bacterium]|nr:hypothetical protein [Candidatus Nomurabacteria bacterium]
MKQWPWVILILFVQETVTLNGLLVKTHQWDYSIWIITLLFIIATTVDIIIGYAIGRYAKKRFNNGKVKAFAVKWSLRLTAYMGKHQRKIYLVLLGYFSFPYLNAFITAWLDISFAESFFYLFVGNMIFYITSWLLVLGITSIVPNPFIAFIAVILVTILVTIAARIWRARKI